MNFKAVLFDLDDTLCNTSASKIQVFGKIRKDNPKLQTLPYTDTIALFVKERQRYLKEAEGFQSFARVDFWLRIAKSLNIAISVKELKKIIDDYWKFTLSELNLYADTEHVLGELRKKNVKTAVLASSDFYSKSSKLIKLKIDKYFDYVFTSDLVKLPKTDPSIYKYVSRFLKIKAGEIVMVGDDPTQDIVPAKKAGFTTVQALMSGIKNLAKRGPSKPNFAIYKLRGILDIMSR